MKLAYTTLGCPEWDLDQIIKRTREYGFDGVDFRGYLTALDITETAEFSSRATETARRLADAGIEVPCLSTSISVNGNAEKRAANLAEVHRYAKLCPIFGATFLRVFGHGDAEPREQAVDNFVAHVRPLLKVAQDYGAIILLETHDTWSESGPIKDVMQRIDSPSLQVLWDIHHPLVAGKETIEHTWEALGKWVRYTHWKDATHADKLCLMGQGILPLAAWYRLLRTSGYDGYCTLEWEKRWHPDIADPEVALPDYVRLMNNLEITGGGNP